ncbi:uncharacterized protein K460DRAFT_133137 [Cucurbitaria berberidis CBS 394.84]|uniref:Uncharacterized protein n=1 Tax=Cucurbitaria berberidis CBS 394.84 TaxID=1168544 RepID=A0A9P4GBC0_9PLEO|nr:uncharacterized protein K460DRAFT_133137 [Cucurbitaria berberidis CBS 394.84]KAF1842688.1 hypothetical protein K460DRAFT_133137 [Cucurbitaria berberidis CBS 394.84]
MASNADLTAPSPPARIPKLKYRNPLPSDPDCPSPRTSQDTAIPSSHSQEGPATSDFKPVSTSSRPSFETASLTSPSLASTSSSATSSNDSRSSKKKKKTGSVLGFLSLKEPSQVALEQFAEHQRKQTATKGSSTPTSKHSSSTFVGKQLPSNVPKVNSKWDGVPAAAKNRSSMSSVSTKDNRSSLSSRGSLNAQLKAGPWNDSKLSVMSDGTRNPPNSIASAAPSVSNFVVADHDLVYGSSPSTTTLPEMSYYFPDAPTMSGALPKNSLETEGIHEPIAGSPPRLPASTLDSSPISEDRAVFRADSPASSTDSVDTVVRDTADVIFKKLNDQPHQSFWGEEPIVQQSDESKPGNVPDSHDFLFGPPSAEDTTKIDSPMASPPVSHYVPTRPVQNYSRPIASNSFTPRPATYRSTPSASALPTLYEASVASTESLATVRDDSDARSLAPSSIAPSELSGHWYESPRERLGLGGRLRKNDVVPWDDQGQSLASCVRQS